MLDVPGVGLGHATVWRDEPTPPEGRGVARTGVTVLRVAEDAFPRPVPAGGAVLNGAGECTGFITAGEWGLAETPVLLTSTMQLGRVYDAACRSDARGESRRSARTSSSRWSAECDDSFLNDARRMQVEHEDDVRGAWRGAGLASARRRRRDEGRSASGTGMSCLGLQGRHRDGVPGRAPGTPSASC